MVGWPVSADLILLPLMCVEQCTFLIFLLCEKNAFYFHSTTEQRPNLWLFCFKGTITRHVSTNKWSHQACTLQKVNNNIKSQQKLQKKNIVVTNVTVFWKLHTAYTMAKQVWIRLRIQTAQTVQVHIEYNRAITTVTHVPYNDFSTNNYNRWHHTMRKTKQLLWRLLFNRNIHAGLTAEGLTTQLCMSNTSQP